MLMLDSDEEYELRGGGKEDYNIFMLNMASKERRKDDVNVLSTLMYSFCSLHGTEPKLEYCTVNKGRDGTVAYFSHDDERREGHQRRRYVVNLLITV